MFFPYHGSQPCRGEGACVTQWSDQLCCAGPPKTDGSRWRVLTKHGPLEEVVFASHSSILAMRIPWTVWKGKKIWYGKVSPLGWKVSSRLLGNSSWAIKTLKDDAVKVLHAGHQQIWKTQQWPQDWRRSLFIPVSKKGNTKECSGYHTVVLISRTSEALFKILQARLQKYVDQKLPDTQARFWRGRGTRDLISNICWIMEKARKFQKKSTSASLIMLKYLTVWITKNWKILKEMRVPDYRTCLPEHPVCRTRSNNGLVHN